MDGKMARRSLLGCASLLLGACVASGPRYVPAAIVPSADTGVIYVYRPKGKLGEQGEAPYVSIAGTSYGALKPGAFVAVTLPEGDVKVTVRQSLFLLVPTIPRSVTVAVAGGTNSYVRVDQTISGADTNGGLTVSQSVAIEEVSSEEGQAALADTRQNGPGL